MKYSLILPVFNEEENIDILYKRCSQVLSKLKQEYELIFINDGSTDTTPQLLFNISKKDCRVKIINLSRNFGHQVAVTAGLEHAGSEIVAVLDADLQDPPEILPRFFKKIEEGYDVVYAIRKSRKENFLLRACYSFFYHLLRRVASIDIPLDSGDFCVLSARAVSALNSLPERNRFIRGLRSWIGFKQIGLEYERQSRHGGVSKYNFSRLMKLAFDGIFSFSFAPLQVMFYLGLLSLFISLLGIIGAVYLKFFTTAYSRVPGFATTIILVMFVGGLQLFSIGILGEYLRRVYEESKHRPQYIIESKIGFK